MIERAKITYSSLTQAFQTKKNNFLKLLTNILKIFSGKMNQLKQVKDIFQSNQLTDLIKGINRNHRNTKIY